MNKMRTVALGGGKGGVGKSFVAVNLAVSLAKTGKRVIMVDADFGGANLHALFGVLQPPSTVADFVSGRAKTLGEVAIRTEVPGLSILAGTCDVLGSVEHAGEQKHALLRALGSLDADVLIIDVGAGTSVHTIDLFNAAETKVLVMTPELTSVQNAYGFLKVAVYRQLSRLVAGSKAEERLKEALGPEAFEIGSTMQKIDTFVSLVSGEAPELERPFRMLLREMNVKLVGNMLATDQDRNTIWAVKRMVETFLSLQSEVAAAFRSNGAVRRSVNTGQPLTARPGASGYDVAEFERLARLVGEEDLGPLRALRAEIARAVGEADAVLGLGLESIEIDIEVDEPPARVEDLRTGDRVTMPVAPPPGEAVPAAQLRDVPVLAGRRARPPREPFVTELDRLRRRDSRREVLVEVELSGCWFLGKLISVDDRVVVRGVHPFGDMIGRTTRMRLVQMADDGDEPSLTVPASVTWCSYDSAVGLATFEPSDPAVAGRLAGHLTSAGSRRRGHAA